MRCEAALAPSTPQMRDREVIRVDFSDDKLGIAASLRQAFASAAHDQSAHDFEKLLRELD